MLALWGDALSYKIIVVRSITSWRFLRIAGRSIVLIYILSNLYSQTYQLVPYVPSVLYENHTQRSSTFWHSSDFDGILRVLGRFLYAIHCFGALIRVQKTESMSHRLQRFAIFFRSLRAMFTRWCFSLSDSMWGTHRSAIFFICRRSVKNR